MRIICIEFKLYYTKKKAHIANNTYEWNANANNIRHF